MIRWLKYLKSNGNIYYKDVTIPTTENERDDKQHFLNLALDRIISEASTSESGIVSRLSKEVRGQQQFSTEGGEQVQNAEGLALESIMVTKVPVTADVETEAITALNDAINAPSSDAEKDDDDEENQTNNEGTLSQHQNNTNDSKPNAGEQKDENKELYAKKKNQLDKWKIHVHNELLNEYQENQFLLSKCFPTLFPLGLSTRDLGGSGPMSTIQRRTLLLFYDRRFAKNINFIFPHFNQDMRRQTNRSVSLRVNRGDARTADLMKMVNEDDFQVDLKLAIDEPESKQATMLKKKVLPLLKILGSKIKWSPFERKSTLGRHYALYHAFGLPFIFGTISPGMRNSPLALRMCAQHTKDTWSIEDGLQLFSSIVLSNIHKRDKDIMTNPVTAAEVFDFQKGLTSLV